MDDLEDRLRQGVAAGVPIGVAASQLVEARCGPMLTIRTLRQLYGVSLVDAKAAWVQAEHGVSLDEFQGNLLDALADALADGPVSERQE